MIELKNKSIMYKVSEENNERFVMGVMSGFRELGAVLVDHKDLGGLCASLTLNTKFGKLNIQLFYTQLHCYSVQSVFDDADGVLGLLEVDSNGFYRFAADSLFGVDVAINKALNHFKKVM